MPETTWMIYGANGYTGRRIVEAAVARGLRPVVAGRNARAIEALAVRLGCEARPFRLESASQVAQHLGGLTAVLHCAGPFSATAGPMMDACLAARVNYLDLTGEIAVVEAAAAHHDRAVEAGVSLIPAVGFDIVPSDCLGAMLAERLPGATLLQLGVFAGQTRVSRGTARTILELLPRGAWIRIDGRLTKVPLGWKTLEIPFPSGPRQGATVPLADAASAWYTTGIPNIEVYMAMPVKQLRQLRRIRGFLPLLGIWPVSTLARWAIRGEISLPTMAGASSERVELWGRVADADGRAVEATLTTPEAYRFTVEVALASLQRVLTGTVRPGFLTPAQAFGARFVLDLPGTEYRPLENA